MTEQSAKKRIAEWQEGLAEVISVLGPGSGAITARELCIDMLQIISEDMRRYGQEFAEIIHKTGTPS